MVLNMDISTRGYHHKVSLPGPHTGPLIGTLEKMVLFNSEIRGGKTDVFPVENEGYA